MPEVTAEDLDYSVEKIQEMATWPYFQGFTASACGKCKETANLLAGGPGWFCPCGHFNVLPWSNMQIPHDLPSYGPPRERIVCALVQAQETAGRAGGKVWLVALIALLTLLFAAGMALWVLVPAAGSLTF